MYFNVNVDDRDGVSIQFCDCFYVRKNLLKRYVKRKISEGTNGTQKQTKYKSNYRQIDIQWTQIAFIM